MCYLKKDSLTIEHINAQSLQSNFAEIKILLAERNIDILCVSETWLLVDSMDSHINIPNFNLFRCDLGRGGGMRIYVSNQLKTNVIILSIPKQPGIEDVWVSVQSLCYQPLLLDVFIDILSPMSFLLNIFKMFLDNYV